MSSPGSGCTYTPSASRSVACTVYWNRIIRPPRPRPWKGTARRSSSSLRALFGAMSSRTKTLLAALASSTPTAVSIATSTKIVSPGPYVSAVPSPSASSDGVDVISTDAITGVRSVPLFTGWLTKSATWLVLASCSGFVPGLL